jgi:hypothetical protein
LVKKLTVKCKTLGVGSFSVAILYGKYTACGAGYIGMKVGVKGRDRLRGELDRRIEQRKK